MRDRYVIMRVVSVALLLYALCTLTQARWELYREQRQTRELEQRKQELLLEQQSLEELLKKAEDPETIRRLAWEKLRMVLPDETVFAFTKAEEEAFSR